ncbi:hypothetical protein PMIN01_04624 [Paraphaeosphaeria minitans]|uniref:Uncharacterized protein n=1 Tax=Paraphaeosphaeria minitans TaxID=565426 RepID=A0A9P6GKU5_9PLEO|nr:hypothetical protein PMIN01_04624 [Paraphaeosphaeria minitans]
MAFSSKQGIVASEFHVAKITIYKTLDDEHAWVCRSLATADPGIVNFHVFHGALLLYEAVKREKKVSRCAARVWGGSTASCSAPGRSWDLQLVSDVSRRIGLGFAHDRNTSGTRYAYREYCCIAHSCIRGAARYYAPPDGPRRGAERGHLRLQQLDAYAFGRLERRSRCHEAARGEGGTLGLGGYGWKDTRASAEGL